MKQKYSRFIVRLIFLTLFIGLAGWALGILFPEAVTSAFPAMLGLFFIVTAGIHYILLRITGLNPRRFVSYFMLATSLKLIIYLGAVLFYVFTVRADLLTFIATFMVLYLVFTIFEVILILKQSKG